MLLEEKNLTDIIERERNRLKLLLGGEEKYTISYLGGGDFMVHVMGIDLEIDHVIKEFNNKC